MWYCPFKDGDLLLLIERMLHLRGLDTVRITMLIKVWCWTVGFGNLTGWATMLLMRLLTLVVGGLVMLSLVCGRWYPVLVDFHRFFIAIARAVVNHDGREGTAPDPLVWSAGALPKRRSWFMRFETGHSCLDLWHLAFGMVSKFLHLLSVLRTLLVGLFPLVSWFNGSPFQEVSIGLLVVWIWGLVAFLMWSCSFFMSFGLVRGSLWKKTQMSAVPFVLGIDISRSCCFIGSLMRSLCLLLGGLGRFVPCCIGANHCRLHHIG